MRRLQIVIDTNVLVAALRSQSGASYKLLMLLGGDKFDINLSVPLAIEYEDVGKRMLGEIRLDIDDLEDVLDFLCSIARRQKIYYLWRPFLRDPKDDMLLELAMAADCETIVTYNKKDFMGIEQFGLRCLNPREFLQEIGELP